MIFWDLDGTDHTHKLALLKKIQIEALQIVGNDSSPFLSICSYLTLSYSCCNPGDNLHHLELVDLVQLSQGPNSSHYWQAEAF